MAASEGEIQKWILLELQKVDGVKVWRQNAGALRDRNGRLVRYGIPGWADISGIAAPEGWRIELEVKRPGERLSDRQCKWRRMIEAVGGIYLVAHSPEEAFRLLTLELCKRRTKTA